MKSLVQGTWLIVFAWYGLMQMTSLACGDVPAKPGSFDTTQVSSNSGTKVIAYYLHGTERCPTCRKIEAYAQEAVEKGFPKEIQAGKLEWKSVDYDLPANKHFITDYKIPCPSLVLVNLDRGKQVRWKLIPETWELVFEKEKFFPFVQNAVRESMAAAVSSR